MLERVDVEDSVLAVDDSNVSFEVEDG